MYYIMHLAPKNEQKLQLLAFTIVCFFLWLTVSQLWKNEPRPAPLGLFFLRLELVEDETCWREREREVI